MPRKARPNTAVVEIKFRVPKGYSAAKARRLIWNHFTGAYDPVYLDWDEEEALGTGTLKTRLGKARIERPKKCR